MTDPLRVVVADDDARIREDFRLLLDLEPDIEVVATAPDGVAAVARCVQASADVCVMDVRMPVLDGIGATHRLREAGTPTRVLVVTTFDLDEYVLGAVRAGAAGFLLKDRASEELATSVRTVARGEGIVAPRATARLLQEFTRPVMRTASRLTERETEIVRLMAGGLRNDEIAQEAHISRATVKAHVSSILSKLGLTSRIQVVVWAYETGLAPAPAARP